MYYEVKSKIRSTCTVNRTFF